MQHDTLERSRISGLTARCTTKQSIDCGDQSGRDLVDRWLAGT